MSVGKQLYSTCSIWHASILHYLYGAESLAKVIAIDKFKSEWSFAVPVCDAEIDIANYEKNELTTLVLRRLTFTHSTFYHNSNDR